MTEAFTKYCRDAAVEHALRPEAGQEDTLALIDAALKRAYGWRVENPGSAAGVVLSLLERAKRLAKPGPVIVNVGGDPLQGWREAGWRVEGIPPSNPIPGPCKCTRGVEYEVLSSFRGQNPREED
jgi:hypothetical protein